MRALRVVALGLARLVGTLLLVVASLLLHLGTANGRGALRDVAAALLPDLAPGRLTVREVRSFGPSRVELAGVSWRDAAGQPVVEEARVVVTPAWRLVPALLGRGAYPRIEAHARRVWARVPTLPTQPAGDGRAAQPAKPLDLALPRIALSVDEVVNALGGPPWAVRDLRADASLVVRRDEPDLTLRLLRADIGVADLAPLRLDANARVRGPRDVNALVALQGPPAGCSLRAWSRGGDVTVTTEGCELSSRLLSTLAGRSLPAVRVERLTAQRARDDAMALDARVVVGGERFVLSARSRGDETTASIAPERARLGWLEGERPPLEIDGPIRANVTRLEGGWALALDTTQVRARVQGFDVPGVIASARLLGTRAELLSLRAPSIGLTARGTMDLAQGVSSARVEAETDALPLARVAPEGVALAGSADLRLSARGEGDAIRVAVRGSVRGLRASGVRAREVTVDASATIAQGRNDIHARVDVADLRAAGNGPIDATVHAEGDPNGTLRFRVRGTGTLPPAVRAQLAPTGARVATVAVDGSVVRSERATRVTVARADLRAGPITLGVRGSVALATPPSGTRLEGVDLDLATPGGGHLRARVAGTIADLTLRDISLRALAPVVPALAPVGGVVDGSAHLDLAHPERSGGEIRVDGLQAPYFGRMSPVIELRPARDGVNELRVAWNVHDAPPTVAVLSARLPRRFDDARGWIDGLQSGEIPLPPVDASVFQENVGRGARVRGTVAARLDLARVGRDLMKVEVHLEGTELVFGVGILGLRRDLVDPMRLRVAICTEVDTRRGFNDPLRARAALGPAAESDEAPDYFNCDPAVRPLPAALVDFAAAVEGPWLDAVGALGGLGADALGAPPAGLMDRLARVPLHLSLNVGPIVRARWPLRPVRLPGMPASLRDVLAPPVEPETRVGAEFRIEGSAAAPRASLTVSAYTPKITQAGLEAPVALTAFAALRPMGATWADPLALEFDLRGAIAPDAPPAERGEINARARVTGRLAEARRGRAALNLEQLEVTTQNIRAERFALLAQRGARGGLDVRVRRTEDPARPFDAVVTLRDVHASPPGLERVARQIPPVGATLHAFLVQQGEAATLKGCLTAGVRETPAPCDPRPPNAPSQAGERELRVDGELPFPRGILAEPDTEQLALAMRAEGFQLDALAALAPTTAVDNVGGVLRGELVWSAERPLRPMGEISLRDGRATLASLGEPFSDLDLGVWVGGNRVEVRRLRGRLGGGDIDVTGTAVLGNLEDIARVELEARMRQFPAIGNGNTWGWITGAVGLQANVRASGVDLDVRVHEAQVRVQEEPRRELIALSADPAVFVMGRTQLARTEVADTTPINLRWALETPIWLRRSDFAIAVTGSGSVHMDRAGNAVAANIEAARSPSWVSFYGKRFELERVNVTLDGSVTVNPILDLRARHETARDGNIVLTLQGRLYEPDIRLVAQDFPDMGMAEVLQLLLVGRRDNGPTTGQTDLATQATDAARSLVTGLTLGFVTSTLRAQFAWLPTLIVEPGTSDAGRYGAGFNLGPRWYLQATWGTAASSMGLATSGASGATQEFRALLEYAITQALSASVSGAFGQQGEWRVGADAYWSP